MLYNNLKVHFAGLESAMFAPTVYDAGVRYGLFSAYNGIAKKFNLPTISFNYGKPYPIADAVIKPAKHIIMDSGLFTLMFGAGKRKEGYNEAFLERWMYALVDYAKELNAPFHCVEVDCQKVLNVKAAWKFREKMRSLLPAQNPMINVFHMEDGKQGLFDLVDYSDYIAISVPELRIHFGKNYKDAVYRFACEIKNRKPEIDIHLLGCTVADVLSKCKFCSTADSTSWMQIGKYGSHKNHHISTIRDEQKEAIRTRLYQILEPYTTGEKLQGSLKALTGYWIVCHHLLSEYTDWCGSQA